jgi:hypothetical protein
LSNHVKEVWTPKYMTASGPLVQRGGCCGGFLCSSSTSGTIAITSGTVSGGSTIVASLAVTAGQFVELGHYYQDGAYVTLTNCAGTFQV